MPIKFQNSRYTKIYHDSDHRGINATVINFRKEFYWNGMAKEVFNYVSYYQCNDRKFVTDTMLPPNFTCFPYFNQ